MLGRGGRADKRITATVAYILKCPASTVPQAMRACKFTDKESKHAGMQMAVRRARDKALAGKKRPPPPSVISASRSGKKSVSPLSSVFTGSTALSSPSTPGSTRLTQSSPRLAKEKPKVKAIQRNSRAMQKVRVNKLATSDFAKRALKRTTKWYARERNIPGGLSSYQIEKKVKQEYSGVGPHATTIRRYVNANLQGFSPLKIGVRGDIPSSSFQSLCLAFESYVRIMQINSKEGEITFKKLSAKINAVLRHNYRQKMLQRVLSATARNLDASTMHIAEDRRVRWTTHANISSWFGNWEFDLVDLGFAVRAADGKVTIPDEQLPFILNFDETCLSLDGTEGRRGGQPEITLHDPRLPYNGKRSNKDSLTPTLIWRMIMDTMLGHWGPRMGQMGASSSRKQCKLCLLINLTPLPCVESMILL